MCKFMVATLDDFNIILRVEFFMQANVVFFHHLRLLKILDEAAPYTIKHMLLNYHLALPWYLSFNRKLGCTGAKNHISYI